MKTFTSVTSKIQTITLSRGRSPLQDSRCLPAGDKFGRRLLLPLLFLCAAFVQPCAATPAQWEPTGSLNAARADHTATLLLNGKVLAAGGFDNFPTSGERFLKSAELYDPASGTWTVTGRLRVRCAFHTATLLPDGKVLVVGGTNYDIFAISSAELYDPASGTWSVTGSLATGRYSHTATLLPNGKVLVAGGYSVSGSEASAELYDPASGTWSVTGSLNTARERHTATLLTNGKVLVAGGAFGPALSSAELYDPASGTWSVTGSLATARFSNTATLLPDGNVLVTGGSDYFNVFSSTELYDPMSGTWSVTGSLSDPRFNHTATLLGDGKVLATGGRHNDGTAIRTAELYDPATGAWTGTGSPNNARYEYRATLLPSGDVLVAGGFDRNLIATATAELYDSGIVPATHADGHGIFDSQGNEVSFSFRATQAEDGTKLGRFGFCDPAAGVCVIKGIIRSLSITGNTAYFSGEARLDDGSRVTFYVNATDNGEPGTLDAMSIIVSNGYSASGTLTSGNIHIY